MILIALLSLRANLIVTIELSCREKSLFTVGYGDDARLYIQPTMGENVMAWLVNVAR